VYSGAALAAPLYTLTVVGAAGSEANDINAFGQMVGTQRTGTGGGADPRAFYFDGSTSIDLSPVVGLRSIASHLNDSGTIVGRSIPAFQAPALPMRQVRCCRCHCR
jgi:uncharacterized membrane protein